jgi:NADH dehydrogenase [ubiquinone] 1 alpha subcomplex assembly factor 3
LLSPQRRQIHSSPTRALSSPPPETHDRGPASTETTQTDFSNLDVLGGTPVPSTAIDACLWDGFHLNNGVKITQGAGVLLVGGEAFGWRPWDAGSGTQRGEGKRLLNGRGQWEVEDGAWGLLEVVWPKPGS